MHPPLCGNTVCDSGRTEANEDLYDGVYIRAEHYEGALGQTATRGLDDVSSGTIRPAYEDFARSRGIDPGAVRADLARIRDRYRGPAGQRGLGRLLADTYRVRECPKATVRPSRIRLCQKLCHGIRIQPNTL